MQVATAVSHSCFLLSFSEDEAKLGARRLARCLQKLGFKVGMILKLLLATLKLVKKRNAVGS